jgi:hypothetical protein
MDQENKFYQEHDIYPDLGSHNPIKSFPAGNDPMRRALLRTILEEAQRQLDRP